MTPEMHQQIEAMQRDLAKALEDRKRLETALEEVLRMEGEQVVRESSRFEAWLDRKYRALEQAREALRAVREIQS